MNPEAPDHRPAGYAFLVDKYQVNVIPNWHTSSVSSKSAHHSTVHKGPVAAVYALSYWPGDRDGDHLEFALKYDGVNLGILSALFEAIAEEEILAYVSSKPTGKYARRIWFLFELLTGRELALENLGRGNYVDLLEPDLYYTAATGRRAQRQRIIDNLLGGRSFCPVVRRTQKLIEMENIDLQKRCEEVVKSYPPELLRRALIYLYTKETKSSFEIEHTKPSASRTEKFIGLLELAEHKNFCEKSLLIEVQNRTIDPRFRASDYRTIQNYVGQTVSYQKNIIHYVCPKPEDIPDLMAGLLLSHERMTEGHVAAVVHAATISYGFNFMHPFEDGNGRIHRFLIHNILAYRGMIPKGLMFPVSAAMLKNPADYDRSLEAFSRPLMQLLEYTLDDRGQMNVLNESGRWYRYIDMTAQAEALFDFIRITIDTELVEELSFLAGYDKTKKAIQEIVDMPDRLIDLFIQQCLQNNGRLSDRKRTTHFGFLSDAELINMEKVVQSGFNNGSESKFY
ncbi:MAG: Fic family protein [Deltaproteobacteria bacterium]|nr:Fic family protein [Deltaproteobacteria bacterium]